MFGSHPKKSTSWRNHPHPIHILVLWQTYLENVNPLTKILHTPTMQQQIIEASGNLHNISKAQDALMFAIYSITVTSMSDEDCQKMIGEARSTLLDRYTLATQQALLRVRFLRTSDIVVLQALVLFLVSPAESTLSSLPPSKNRGPYLTFPTFCGPQILIVAFEAKCLVSL